MGRIKEVQYKEIDNSIYSIENASQFQFLYNMMDVGYMDEYEEFEKAQINIRNAILPELIGNASTSAIIGTSDFTKNVVVICDI